MVHLQGTRGVTDGVDKKSEPLKPTVYSRFEGCLAVDKEPRDLVDDGVHLRLKDNNYRRTNHGTIQRHENAKAASLRAEQENDPLSHLCERELTVAIHNRIMLKNILHAFLPSKTNVQVHTPVPARPKDTEAFSTC